MLEALKQTRCAHCGRVGTLNRHDRLKGNDAHRVDKQRVRGRRAWCSNRGRRGGCGRTMAVLLVWVLPRHSVPAGLLNNLLEGLRTGASVQASWRRGRFPFPLETVYHLLQRLRRRLAAVRTALLSRCPPPHTTDRDPLRQTLEHLHCAFPSHPCAIEAFQYTFQLPWMG